MFLEVIERRYKVMNKKILGFFALAFGLVLSMSFAMAETLTISSNESMEWSADGVNWYPAYATWVHPIWSTIPGATWMWRTPQTNPVEEYNNVPNGGWYFRQSFEIPRCFSNEVIPGTITSAVDNSYEMYFNGNLVETRGSMNKDGPDSWYHWVANTSSNLSGLVVGENTISFRAMNHYSFGSYQTNPAGLIFQLNIDYDPQQCAPNLICENSIEEAGYQWQGVNRWIVTNGEFATYRSNGRGPEKNYTLEQTHGCSCSGILNWLNQNYPGQYGNMQGHYRFGCSSSIMDAFINLTSQY